LSSTCPTQAQIVNAWFFSSNASLVLPQAWTSKDPTHVT